MATAAQSSTKNASAKLELTHIPAAGNVQCQIAPDECLIFTHIPKAAGTTLDRLLKGVSVVSDLVWRRAFGTVYHQYLGKGKREALDDFREWPQALRARVRIITGHVPYGVHRDLPRRPRYVTLLRDPVSRTLSHYKMGVSRQGWSADAPIEQVFGQGGLCSDVQVRLLAGIESPYDTVDDNALTLALDNLKQHYLLVGFSDTFNLFTSAVLGFLGAPGALLGTEQTGRVDLAPEQEQRIRELAPHFNQWDTILYQEARAIAQQKLKDLLGGDGTAVPVPNQKTLLASSQVKVKNQEYSIIPPDQLEPILAKFQGMGVAIRR